MSVLASLKTDIEAVDKDLARELLILVDAETKVKVLKEQSSRLKRALDILEGRDTDQGVHDKFMQAVAVKEEVYSPSPPPPSAVPLPAPIPKPSHPLCGACSGKMLQSYTRVPSGAMVPVMRCQDCNNENY